MATLTSLGFSIFSTYSGTGTAAARRDLNGLTTDLKASNAKLGDSARGFASVSMAAATLGPALIPISGGILGIGAAAGAMGTAAIIGFGALAGVIKMQIGNIENMKATHMKMTATEKDFITTQDKLTKSLGAFSVATRSASVAPLVPVMSALSGVMTKLVPTYLAAAAGLTVFGKALGKYLSSSVFTSFIKVLTIDIKPIVTNLSMSFLRLFQVMIQGVKTFLPDGVKLSAIIKQGADNLKRWSDNGGFANFLTVVHNNAPAVKEFFKALGDALLNVGKSMGGLGPSSLTLATALLKMVAALPPSWIQAIVIGFAAWRTIMLGMAVVSVLSAAIGVLQVVLSTLNFVLVALGITWTTFFFWVTIIIVGVAALVVGIIYLVTHWTQVWNAVKETAMTVWNFLTHGLGQLVLLLLGPIGVLILLGAHWKAIWEGAKALAAVVWQWMQTAWSATVNGLITAWQAVSGALTAAWNAVWNAIKTAGQAVWNAIMTAWHAVGDAFTSVWNTVSNALKSAWNAAWNAIKTVAETIWNWLKNAALTLANDLVTAIRNCVNTIQNVWNTAWNAVKTIANTIWTWIKNTLLKLASDLVTAIRNCVNTIQNVWNTAWNAVKNAAQAVWNAITSGFDKFKNGLTSATKALMNALSSAWSAGAKAIGKAWEEIKKLVRDPIQAVVNVVYNNGIVKLWNIVAGAFGAPTLKAFTLPAFADGGAVRGPGTGTSDSIHAKLSNNEHVVTAQEVAGAGGHAAVAAQRQAWAHNSGVGHVRLGTSGHNFAAGGVHIPGTNIDIPTPGDIISGAFDAVTGFAGSVLDKLKSLALGAIGGVVNPLIQKAADTGKTLVKGIIPGTPMIEKLIVGDGTTATTAVPSPTTPTQQVPGGTTATATVAGTGLIQKMADYIKNWITAHDIAPTSGGNTAGAQKWADAQIGKPYSLGGNFGTTFDCSQFMSGITQVILGKPASPLFTTFAFTGAKEGPATFEKDLKAPFMVGVTNEGVGHMAGTLNGKNYEATPPAVRSGPSARGYNDPMFPMQYGMKASALGGVIPAGDHLAIIDAALAAAGVPPPGDKASWEAGLNTLITRESNWNAGAINLTDSNATAGMPSQGLAQVIPPTFAAYHVAGTSSNILDPVANVAAAIRYIVATYGNITNVQQANASLPPKGYRKGTDRAHKGWHMIDEEGGEWINFKGGEKVLPHGKRPKSGDGTPVVVEVTNHWHGNPTKDAVQHAETGMCESLRQAVHAGVGGRPH